MGFVTPANPELQRPIVLPRFARAGARRRIPVSLPDLPVNRSSKRLPVAGLAAVVLLGAVWARACRRPADQEITAQLDSASQVYGDVLGMLAQDPKVGTVGDTFLFETDRPYFDADAQKLGITDARVSEYRRLLKMGGARRVDRLDGGAIQFLLWARGFAGNTHHKGLVWSKQVLAKDGSRRFTHVRGDWYLFED